MYVNINNFSTYVDRTKREIREKDFTNVEEIMR